MWEKNLAKIWLKTTKNPQWSLAKSERERESKVWKSVLNESKYYFKKNLIHDVRLIKKRVRSIEPSKGLLKFFKRISIDWKLDWINWNSEKKKMLFRKVTWVLKTYLKALNIRNKNAWVWDEWFSQNPSFKPNFPKILVLNNLPSILSNKSVLHKTQSIFQTWLVRP